MNISRERKVYGIILALAVGALTADRLLFDVPLSGPSQAAADEFVDAAPSHAEPVRDRKPPSLKLRIDSFRERAPEVSENAFVMRSSPETESAVQVALDSVESDVAINTGTFSLGAVGGVGTERAFAQVNGILLRPGIADESGLMLVSLDKQESKQGESFQAVVRTAEGREVALRMTIGGRDER